MAGKILAVAKVPNILVIKVTSNTQGICFNNKALANMPDHDVIFVMIGQYACFGHEN